MYRYNGRREVVNKLQGIETVTTINVTHRQPFDITAPSFIVNVDVADSVRMSNYCAFTYHDIKYCCYVNLVSESTNMYSVNCFIDTLTTAYVNGCFADVSDKILYSYLGDSKLFDNRLKLNPIKDTTVLPLDFSSGSTIFLAVLTPFAKEYDPNIINPNNLNWNKYGNTPVDIYAMTPAQYNEFISNFRQLDEEIQVQYIPSILGVYQAFLDIDLGDIWKTTNTISLSSCIDTSLVGDGFIVRSVEIATHCYLMYNPPKHTITANSDIIDALNPIDEYCSTINVDLKEFGKMSFHPYHYGISTINSLKFEITLDIPSRTSLTYPIINGNKLRDIYALNTLPNTFPIAYNTHINTQTQAQLLTTGYIASLVGGVAGLVSDPVSAGLGLYNASVSYESQKHAMDISMRTGTTLSGVVGGNPYVTNDHKGILTMTRERALNMSQYQSTYGKPDFKYRNISTLTQQGGYFMTENVKLKANGLPIAVITNAESIINSGVWFTN